MKLSTRGEYGLRAMVYLAMRDGSEDEMVHAQEISDAQDIPPHYLKQILSRLRASGLIRSTRGPSGGHSLARSAAEIPVGEVIRCLEGEATGVEGVLSMPCKIQVGSAHCVIREFLLEMKRRVESLLDETSLADLATRQDELVKGPILVRPRIMMGTNEDTCEEAPVRRTADVP